jgi:hypothetical protein
VAGGDPISARTRHTAAIAVHVHPLPSNSPGVRHNADQLRQLVSRSGVF